MGKGPYLRIPRNELRGRVEGSNQTEKTNTVKGPVIAGDAGSIVRGLRVSRCLACTTYGERRFRTNLFRCDPPTSDPSAGRSEDGVGGETTHTSSNRNKHAPSALTLVFSMQRAGSSPFHGRTASSCRRQSVARSFSTKRSTSLATTRDLPRLSIGSRVSVVPPPLFRRLSLHLQLH